MKSSLSNLFYKGSHMIVTKAPAEYPTNMPSVFLAGSIEMGKAVDWQTQLTNELQDLNVSVLNPRRDDWDSSWEQKKENDQFREQVEWELEALEHCDVIALYFDPATKSPISLLELGIHTGGGKLVVCCPEGFWRKGNVDIVCEMYGVTQVDSIEGLVAEVRERLSGLVMPSSEKMEETDIIDS
jgi:hypothetical protein